MKKGNILLFALAFGSLVQASGNRDVKKDARNNALVQRILGRRKLKGCKCTVSVEGERKKGGDWLSVLKKLVKGEPSRRNKTVDAKTVAQALNRHKCPGRRSPRNGKGGIRRKGSE